MALSLTITAILSILVGILVLVFPKFLRLVIGFYLIALGIMQLF